MFDKKVCKELGAKVQAALDEAFKDSGFDVALAGGRFEDLEFTMRVKFTITDSETKAHRDYREYAARPYTSFPPDMLDASFPYGRAGDEVTVLGWLPNRPKMDILLHVKGKQRIAPSADVIRAYERKFGRYIKPSDEVKGTLIETAPPSNIPAILKDN